MTDESEIERTIDGILDGHKLLHYTPITQEEQGVLTVFENGSTIRISICMEPEKIRGLHSVDHTTDYEDQNETVG